MSASTFEVSHDVDAVHIPQLMDLFASAWWATQRTETEARGILAGSDIVVTVAHRPTGRLLGFARVLTDSTYLAVILDVIVASDVRGSGVATLIWTPFSGIHGSRTSRAPSWYASQTWSRSISGGDSPIKLASLGSCAGPRTRRSLVASDIASPDPAGRTTFGMSVHGYESGRRSEVFTHRYLVRRAESPRRCHLRSRLSA